MALCRKEVHMLKSQHTRHLFYGHILSASESKARCKVGFRRMFTADPLSKSTTRNRIFLPGPKSTMHYHLVENVLQFNIAMYDVMLVQVEKPVTNLLYDAAGCGFVHKYFLLQEIVQVSRSTKFQQQVQGVLIVKKCI